MKRSRLYWAAAIMVIFPATAWAQTLGQNTDDGISAGRVLAALTFCLLLGAGMVMAIRKWGGSFKKFHVSQSKIRRLNLRETLRVNAQVQICLVACDDKEMLIAVSPQGVQMLGPSGGSIGISGAAAGSVDGAGENS